MFRLHSSPRFACWLVSGIAGLSFANIFILYPLQKLSTFPGKLTAFLLLAFLFSLPAHFTLKRFLLPALTGFKKPVQILLLAACFALGLFMFLRLPVPVPSNNLFSGLRILNRVTGYFSAGFGGGWLLLMLVLYLGKASQPIPLRFSLVTMFFFAYLLLGLSVYQDYGLSVDETREKETSLVSLKTVLSLFDSKLAENKYAHLSDLAEYRDRLYGVAFTLPVAALEEAITFPDVSNAWLFRHFCSFLFFYIGTAAFYLLVEETFNDWRLALVGVVLLVLSPRIFAPSFYDVKDAPFLAAFTIALLFARRYWQQRNLLNGLLLGISSAYAVGIRVIAIFVPLLALGVVLFDLAARRFKPNKELWFSLSAMGVGFLAMLYLTWPVTWSNPVLTLYQALVAFSDFGGWNGSVVYLGDYIHCTRLPWHYLPVWLLISIPISSLFLFLTGVFALGRQMVRQKLRFLLGKERELLFFLLIFLLPVLAAILLGSTLYGGWRHFFFTYPSFLMLVLFGLRTLLHQYSRFRLAGVLKWGLVLLLGLIGLDQLNIARWMAVNHPYQNIYFNEMVNLFGGRTRFERDTARTCSRQGAEYILAAKSGKADISVISKFEADRFEILPQQERTRLNFLPYSRNAVLKNTADYFMDVYRPPLEMEDPELNRYLQSKEHDSIEVDGLPILTLYKLK